MGGHEPLCGDQNEMSLQSNFKKALQHATVVLGDEVAAQDWLEQYSATLGAVPMNLLETTDGLYRVLLHLSNISRHRSE